jgi:hypothetical protein
MKPVLGMIFYLLAVAIGLFVTILLFLQLLTTLGMISSNGREPGLFTASFFFLFGAMLAIFLQRLGRNILASRNELSVGTKTNLLLIGMVIDVAVFLKSVVPFLTRGHGVWPGTVALLSVVTFAALCWMLSKI